MKTQLEIKCIYRWCILLLLIGVSLNVAGQGNLLRNPSFENQVGAAPHRLDLFGRCTVWKKYATLLQGAPSTPDYFKDTPNAFKGTISCGLSSEQTFNIWPLVPRDHESHYVGLVKWAHFREGEGVQQHLQRKLDACRYNLTFDYLVPCDTMDYVLDVYLGAGENHCTYLAASIPVPATNVGIWQTLNIPLIVPNQFHQQLDWFIILNEGHYNFVGPGSYDPYIYIDNFDFQKSSCTTCDPTGYISYERDSINFFTRNNDGINDTWCLRNINNATWYRMEVFYHHGARVRTMEGYDANGFENLSICWDGRKDNGQLLTQLSTFDIVTTLGNCNSQHTRLDVVFMTPDAAWDTLLHPFVEYVPPLYGLETPPTHYRNLYLYGGTYWGTHDWYACEAIWLGDWGAPRVPFFRAGSTANLGFYSTDGTFIDVGNTDFQLGADIDIAPQHVDCCPAFRLANPDPQQGLVTNIDSIVLSENILDWEPSEANDLAEPSPTLGADEFFFNVYPNPAADVLNIDLHLPTQDFVKAKLICASGMAISEVLSLTKLEAGNHSFSVSVMSIPDGLYFLQLTRLGGTQVVKVIVQK